MLHLWARYLPILTNYDDMIQIDSFAYNWCLKSHQNMIFLYASIAVIKQDEGGVCHGIVVFLCFLAAKAAQ